MPQDLCLHFCKWMRNEQDAGTLAGREAEHEVDLRNIFTIYIYGLIYISGCISTPVVEARACDYRDLGSSPSGTLLGFFFIFLTFSDLFWQRCASSSWASFFLLLTPLAGYSHYGPFYFLFLIFIYLFS